MVFNLLLHPKIESDEYSRIIYKSFRNKKPIKSNNSMKTTSNGIPYDASRTQNAVILYPSKELHKLPAVIAAKKELKSAGFKTFITWTRAVNRLMPLSERIGK